MSGAGRMIILATGLGGCGLDLAGEQDEQVPARTKPIPWIIAAGVGEELNAYLNGPARSRRR